MASHIRERSRCLEVLGLHNSASEEDIRKAYRNLALQFHPDKNKSDDATEKFQEIQGAYKYLTEGPSVHMHMHEDSDDDDDGIPFFILVRLFPWLFSGYPGAGPSRRHFDPFGYDTDSDEEDLGFFFGGPFSGFQFMRHAAGPHPSYSRGRGHASASRPGTASSHTQQGAAAASSSDKTRRKQEKKKQAKQRKKAEKTAAQATSNGSNNGAAENFRTSSTSNWGLSNNSSQQAAKTEQEKKETEKARMEAERAKREAQERKEAEKEKIEARRAAEKAKKEEEKAERAERTKREAEEAKIEAERAQKAKEEAEKKRMEVEEAEKARREAEKIEKAKEAERIRLQKQEERKKRLEEKQQTAKEVEEMVRADKEKKERRLAAQREKERQEAEERARKEEEEIAEQARLLREEEQRKEEELARRKQEEQDQKELAQLLDEFDTDLFMDNKGEFVTWDTEGVGNIKMQPVMYDASGYTGNIVEEEEMFSGDGGDYQRFQGFRGRYQGYRGRSPRRGRGRGRGQAGFSSPSSSSSYSSYETSSPPFESWDSPPPPQGFPNFGYPPSSPGNQRGGFAQRGDRGRGGQGFHGDRGRGGQGFQGDMGRGGFHDSGCGGNQGFQTDRGHGFQNFRGRGRGQNDWKNRGNGLPGQRGFSDNDVCRDSSFEDPRYSKHPPHPNQRDSAFSSGQGVAGNRQAPFHQPHPAQQHASNHQATFQGGQHPHHNSNIQQQFSGPYQPTSIPSNVKTSSKSNSDFHNSIFPPHPNPSPPQPLQRPPGLMSSMGYNIGGNRGPPPLSSSSVAPPPGVQTATSGTMTYLQNQPPPFRLHTGFNVPPPSSVPTGTSQRVRHPPPGIPSFGSGNGSGGGRGSTPAHLNRFSSGPQLVQQPQQPHFTTAAPTNPFLMNAGLQQQRPYIPPFGSQLGINSLRNIPQKPGSGGLLPMPGSEDPGSKSGMNRHTNPAPFASTDRQGGTRTSSRPVERAPSQGVDLHGLDDIDD